MKEGEAAAEEEKDEELRLADDSFNEDEMHALLASMQDHTPRGGEYEHNGDRVGDAVIV